jgi:hypothetical protein
MMSLAYASGHLQDALRFMAGSEQPLDQRLQAAWDQHVQMLWMKPCLTRDLLKDFRDFWRRYTAPSDDRTSTQLRDLSTDELLRAVDDLASLCYRVCGAAAVSPEDEQLATLADLA